MTEWVKFARGRRGSWHLASGVISRGGMIHLLCGRWAPKDAVTSTFLASHDKSCESCFRNKEIRDRE